mmetsp:Transcript_58834/g.156621  ORF Transcript_58834/g.156621 Transcript_58834/m.156621 type:complete len:218 (-) Transcript_58834:21-674(-)
MSCQTCSCLSFQRGHGLRLGNLRLRRRVSLRKRRLQSRFRHLCILEQSFFLAQLIHELLVECAHLFNLERFLFLHLRRRGHANIRVICERESFFISDQAFGEKFLQRLTSHHLRVAHSGDEVLLDVEAPRFDKGWSRVVTESLAWQLCNKQRSLLRQGCMQLRELGEAGRLQQGPVCTTENVVENSFPFRTGLDLKGSRQRRSWHLDCRNTAPEKYS